MSKRWLPQGLYLAARALQLRFTEAFQVFDTTSLR
jgi:hypothetical protein